MIVRLEKYDRVARATGKKMAPVKGPFSLVIPVTMTPDHDRSVAVIIAVPAAVESTIMRVEFGARPAIVIAVIIPVASDPEAETLCTRHCRRRNRKGRQRSENVGNFLHAGAPIVIARGENGWSFAAFREPSRNFDEYAARFPVRNILSNNRAANRNIRRADQNYLASVLR
jgi:hypothetical protein